MRKTAVIATSAIALTVAGSLVPTQANAAKVKFGSELNETVKPAKSFPGLYCDPFDRDAYCSFVQSEAYGRPHDGEKAPYSGTLKKVRVIAGGPGSFTLQLVKSRQIGGVWQSKVKATGPVLDYDGQSNQNWDFDTYRVEKFRVNMPIKKGWRLAMRATHSSAVRCPAGGPATWLHTPSLSPATGWHSISRDENCWNLIEGVIKH